MPAGCSRTRQWWRWRVSWLGLCGRLGARCRLRAGRGSRLARTPVRRWCTELLINGRMGNAVQPRPSRESSATLMVNAMCIRARGAISALRPKAALRRKFVLRYPTLAYQHEQPSRIHIGWQLHRLRRVPHPASEEKFNVCNAAEKLLLPLDRKKPYQRWRPLARSKRRAAATCCCVSMWADLLDEAATRSNSQQPSHELLCKLTPSIPRRDFATHREELPSWTPLLL